MPKKQEQPKPARPLWVNALIAVAAAAILYGAFYAFQAQAEEPGEGVVPEAPVILESDVPTEAEAAEEPTSEESGVSDRLSAAWKYITGGDADDIIAETSEDLQSKAEELQQREELIELRESELTALEIEMISTQEGVIQESEKLARMIGDLQTCARAAMTGE